MMKARIIFFTGNHNDFAEVEDVNITIGDTTFSVLEMLVKIALREAREVKGGG